jgi:sulfoxide reductase heme-binding subunit YedZ
LYPFLSLAWRIWNFEIADPVDELELQTGRWTLRLLAATLAIAPLRRFTGQNWLIRYRRPLGLFAFFYACLHVLALLFVQHRFVWSDIWLDVIDHKYMIVGALAFLSLVPLAITSTKGWIRRMGGRRWARLHQLVYVAAILGTVHYLWAVKKDAADPLLYLAVFLFLLGFRAYDWLKKRRVATRAMQTGRERAGAAAAQ